MNFINGSDRIFFSLLSLGEELEGGQNVSESGTMTYNFSEESAHTITKPHLTRSISVLVLKRV